jgi:hypothetical protein
LWPGRLILTWSTMMSAASSPSGPIHLRFILPALRLSASSHDRRGSVKRARMAA